MKSFKQYVNEHIVKTDGKYKLVSKKSGKNLGTYPSKAGAEKRERQVQFFKHQNEDAQLDEMGVGAVGSAGPTNTDAGVAGTGDSRLPAAQREPGVSRKKKTSDPRMPMGIGKRKDF